MEKIETLITQISNEEHETVPETLNTIMMDKIATRLEDMKRDVMSNIIGGGKEE